MNNVKIIKGLKSIITFLTIIPMGKDNSLEDMGNYMPLFPLIGLLIGLLSGAFAWSLLHFLSSLIVGILTLGFILLITGLHHTDGLLDFGDGLMYKGSPERKIEVMSDKQTGAGGFAFGFVVLMATALGVGFLSIDRVIQSLILAEISAKLAMVMIAWAGRSAHRGLGTYCVEAMHGSHRPFRLILPLVICLCIAAPLMPIVGFIVIISAMIMGLVMVVISNKHFNGVTGDVFGAVNEIVRMVSLMIILAI